MIGPKFMDEIDCGSFFDHIDDLLEFPPEDVSGGLMGGDCNSFPSIWTSPSDPLAGPESVFSGPNSNSNSDLSAELSVPYEDIVQLEWLSNFVEDSFSGGGNIIALNKEGDSVVKDSPPHHHHQFQTSSPVSVLESSSSCSGGGGGGGKTIPLSPNHRGAAQRARSKRPRPATFNPRPAIQLISPTSSSVTESLQPMLVPKVCSDSENYAESSSPLNKKVPPLKPGSAEHKKKKKMKLSPPLGPVEMMNQISPVQAAVRKCMHCEITKTPQWRAGPMGPKTLCNACGVRYKSGRLFPEYRPAASPTFIPSLHSNSHKKVIEMRNNAVNASATTATTTTTITSSPELILNTTGVSLDYM